MSQHLHKLQKIDPVVSAFFEESVHYSVAERIYRQFRNPEKILSTKCPAVSSIQTGEAAVQSLNLIRRKASNFLDLGYLFLA